MFGFLSGAIKTAAKAISNALSGGAKSAPKSSKGGVVATFKNANVQGSNYNPQKTAKSPQRTSNPQRTVNPQPATWNPQPAYRAVAPSSRSVWASGGSSASRITQAQQDKIREQKRIEMQKQALFEKTKREYEQKIDKLMQQYKDQNKNVFSWLTGNDTNAARDFAQKQLQSLEQNQVGRYDKKLNSFLKEQARRKAEIEKKRFGSQAEFDAAVAGFSKWEQSKISDLEYMRGATEGMYSAYGEAASQRNKSVAGSVGGWFTETAVPFLTDNSIFKYTLGSGDKNAPSVVTAPSRAINTVGNFFRDTRYYHGGKSEKGKAKSWGEAWRDSYEQRNFNIKPAEKGKYQGKSFEQWYKTRDLSQWRDDIDSGRIKEEDVKKLFRRAFDTESKNEEMANNVTEFFADPLFLAGSAAKGVSKGATAGLSWASKTAKATKTGAGFFNKLSEAKNSKAIKWLGAEYKTPQQKLGEALTDVKTRQTELQQKLMPRINEFNRRAGIDKQIDTSILDDLAQLTDHEAKVLQRMAAGKFAWRDRVALRDIRGLQYSAPQREKLMDLYERWTDFTEKPIMKLNVSDATSYGRGKRFYAPNTSWIREKGGSLDDYNFRMMKRRKSALSASDMYQGAVDRFMVSNMQNWHRAGEVSRKAGLRSEATRLQRVYNEEMAAARKAAGLDEAFENTKGVISRQKNDKAKGFFGRNFKVRTTGRAFHNSARSIYGAPISLWKKSVLKYRPVWIVNNVLYNTQAGVLAGGGRSLIEQARMLRPKNWRQAMDEIPAGVKADLTGELGGKGKLNRSYNNVENWSRVAAYRAAKSKGMTDAQALKRVDKYLYNYKVKNWERPIKSVLPFWSWNKNLMRASVQMPFDRPLGAKVYNSVDRYQNNQFDAEFEKVVPELTKLGYTEDEIQKIKDEQAKYYRGRLKVGNKWITTPFNAFSEKGLAGFGINPYIAAVGESATAKDSFGRDIGGTESLYRNRLISKFPQAELARKWYQAGRVDLGLDKPRKGWIGEPGSAGYGFTKEAQGYDASKSNYVRSMDPRAKKWQDTFAFAGVPRGLEFSQDELVQRKRLQKVSEAYFGLDTSKMSFDEAETARNKIFKKYGITADDFYKGMLSKYDTENTQRIKGLKEDARAANQKLFDEYGAQPKGTRNLWATQKLRELNASGYFNDNPFKESFDWIDPNSVARADRQSLYQQSKASGDWSAWRDRYGDTRSQKARDYELAQRTGDWSSFEKRYGRTAKAEARDEAMKTGNWASYYAQYGKSQKALDVEAALASGDWTSYNKKYGISHTETPYQYEGKFFKSQQSMDRYKEGVFWHEYGNASAEERRRMLAQHPEYNHRANWTDKQWDDWKRERDAKLRAEARRYKNFAFLQDAALSENSLKAAPVLANRARPKTRRLIWKT